MREKPVVRLRRDILAAIYGILLIVLLLVNWVGIRERYVVSSVPCTDLLGIAAGDVDVGTPGDELIYWTATNIFVIYNATGIPTVEPVNMSLLTPSNSLAGLVVADFDPDRKGQEIVAVTTNGAILLISRDADSWKSKHVADLPWPSPVWTTRALVGARFDTASSAAELAIVGEYFDWPTMNRTGRVIVVSRVSNVSWQVAVAHTALRPLLSAAAGDLDRTHPGLELLTADDGGAIKALAVTNGSWSSSNFFVWSGVVPSLTMGNLDTSIPGWYEVALVLNGKGFLISSNGTLWQPQQIDGGLAPLGLVQTLTASDVDPFHPGDELLGLEVDRATEDSVVVVLSFDRPHWTRRVLFTFPKGYVTAVQPASFDFSRAGIEVVVASKYLLSVYGILSSADRTVRATSAVLVPAFVLLPGTIILFLLADHVGRVAAERRRRYSLRMAARGFAQCPVCKRFLPRANLEAHRRVHRRRQTILTS